jgi:hypothetical protein
VNWLRARARCQRWEEELLLVQNEMRWTTLWFKHQEHIWIERVKKSIQLQSTGHGCYASKQVYIWGQFIKEAEQAFKLLV